MDTAIRTQTAFRLNNHLLEKLKRNARKANMSLNAYVEEALEEVAGKDFDFPQLTEEFFLKNREFSESFVIQGAQLPKAYEGLDGYGQAEMDDKLLMEAKYEENL